MRRGVIRLKVVSETKLIPNDRYTNIRATSKTAAKYLDCYRVLQLMDKVSRSINDVAFLAVQMFHPLSLA